MVNSRCQSINPFLAPNRFVISVSFPPSLSVLVPRYLNHFSTTGRCSDPAHYDVSIRQAAGAAFVTSSFKIFLTQVFCDVEPHVFFNILQLIASFSQNPKLLQWRQY